MRAFKQITILTASISCSPESTTYLSGERREVLEANIPELPDRRSSKFAPSSTLNEVNEYRIESEHCKYCGSKDELVGITACDFEGLVVPFMRKRISSESKVRLLL